MKKPKYKQKWQREKAAKHISIAINVVFATLMILAGHAHTYKLEQVVSQVQAAKDKEKAIAENVSGFGRLIKTVEVEKKVYEKPKTIEEKIRATFPEDPENAIAIFKCESGLRPDAFNGNNSNGSTDSGLTQINSVHGVSKHMLMDVDVNLAVARVIYERAGNSWSPWVCARKIGVIK